jgi:putative ABC transport system ATP-binding protein
VSTAEQSPATDAGPLVAAKDLSKVYKMGDVDVWALSHVDFELYPSELVVLLGPSGSGKSTLLNLIGGLDCPSGGTLTFLDCELANAADRQLTQYRRNHVGFVFQFYNLIPSLTARENVALVTEIAPNPLEPEEALAMVDLGDRLDHFPAQLSGGEQQRVAIARAIAKRPDLLLCDEPTGALDAATGTRVLDVLRQINQALHTAIVVITHNAPIADMADRVIKIADGKVAGIRINRDKKKPEEITW